MKYGSEKDTRGMLAQFFLNGVAALIHQLNYDGVAFGQSKIFSPRGIVLKNGW